MQRKPGAAHPSNQGGVGGKQGEGDRRCADTVLVAGASMTLSECFARLDHVVLRANALDVLLKQESFLCHFHPGLQNFLQISQL